MLAHLDTAVENSRTSDLSTHVSTLFVQLSNCQNRAAHSNLAWCKAHTVPEAEAEAEQANGERAEE